MKKLETFILLFFLVINFKTLKAQWIQAKGLNAYSVSSLAVSGTHIYAGTERNGVFLSTDNGVNWVQITSRLTYRLNTIIVFGGYLFAGSQGGGISRFSDSSSTWEKVNSGLTDTVVMVTAFAVNNQGLFAGTLDGLFLSNNNGVTWKPVELGTETNKTVLSLAVQGTNVYVGTNRYDYNGGGVFHSTDNGQTWPVNNNAGPFTSINKLVISGTNILAGTYEDGLFISTDSSKHWSSVNTGLTSKDITALYSYNNKFLVGISGEDQNFIIYYNIFISDNKASTWLQYNMGLTSNIYIYDFVVAGDNILAGTSQGVWIRSINDTVTTTAVNESKIMNPTVFMLFQNYPNPFNPITIIKYDLPKAGRVTLKIYDVLGRKVATLINEEKPAGRYQVEFNGSSFASGVYFYRIQAGNYSSVKKMILLK